MSNRKKLLGLLILLILLMNGCQRKAETPFDVQEIVVISENYGEEPENFSPHSVRYVNARNGLDRRDSPSVSGAILGTLLHGSRIIARERSEHQDTIDGVTAYWYLCSGGVSDGGGWVYWVFGGFLSTTMPEDTAPVLGFWDTDRNGAWFWEEGGFYIARDYWSFWPDYTAATGTKETSTGFTGTWALTEDILIFERKPKITFDYVPFEIERLEIIIEAISRDKIIFHFADGTVEILTRN